MPERRDRGDRHEESRHCRKQIDNLFLEGYARATAEGERKRGGRGVLCHCVCDHTQCHSGVELTALLARSR